MKSESTLTVVAVAAFLVVRLAACSDEADAPAAPDRGEEVTALLHVTPPGAPPTWTPPSRWWWSSTTP